MNSATAPFSQSIGYGQAEVRIPSHGDDVVVISDLHLAAGVNESRNYDGTENFYADDSFTRFIDYLQKNQNGKKQILVINGDFIDFLRIRDLPETDNDFRLWKINLDAIGINKTEEELRKSISKKEKEYGLKTNDYKSVYKLFKCCTGHIKFFEQLAMWVNSGNKLVIVKGNHDLEWYWPAVRDHLEYLLADLIITSQTGQALNEIKALIKRQVLFIDASLIIDDKIFIAHGHLYENITAVFGEPTLNNNTELNLPFGSFFNRYLINRLELSYPFLDNVRPAQKILPILIRERFPLAIKVLFKYLPFTLMIIPKKKYKEVFKNLFDFLVIIIIPVAITGFAIWQNRAVFSSKANGSFLGTQIVTVVKNFGFLFLSYLFGRIISMVRLSPPHSFYSFAEKIFDDNKSLQVVTFGHTHNPEQFKDSNRWYFNTGTWMPVYDLSIADIRIEKTFTYLHLCHDDDCNLKTTDLFRWNDDAMRPELMLLRERK